MAILSALFTALSRKVGDFLQTLLGWSVAALFGRLHRTTRTLVTVALILALAWPVFVVGVFVPSAASWVIAFVPIENEVVSRVLRVVWLVLALVAPMVVGVLVRSASPVENRKSMLAAVFGGYPLSLGMALSFLVTLVTVPALKLVSTARRWSEEHLFVQPRAEKYEATLGHLVEACRAAGLEPQVERVPRVMSLSVRLLRFFSRGAIDSLMVHDPRMVRAEGVELYLYPADLLIRGEPTVVTHVRTRLTATWLERDAYLVESEPAKELHDDLGRALEVLEAHEFPKQAADALWKRLESIVREALRAKGIPFEEWIVIDRLARRLETRLRGEESVVDSVAAERKRVASPEIVAAVPDDASMGELISAITAESKALIRDELELAKQEAIEVARAGVRSAGVGVAGIVFLSSALSLAVVALVTRFEMNAFVAAGALLGVAVISALVAYAGAPKHPMERTVERVDRGLKIIAERTS